MTAATRTPTVWLTRTGEGGYALGDCIANEVVALRYHTVPEASGLTQNEIAQHLRNAPTVTDYNGVAAMLVRFVHDVQEGDIVVTPHLAERRVFFGEITGDYFYEKKSRVPDLLHLRSVRWLGDVERDSLPAERLQEIDLPPTFYEVASQDFWRDRAAAATGEGPVVPPKKAKAPKGTVGEALAAATAKCTSCNMTLSPADIENGLCEACA